ATLINDAGALAFAPLSEPTGKPLALRAYDGATSVVPSQANAIRGSYPLTHDLAFHTAGAPTGETKAFLDWLASPAGQHTVDQAHVVPLYLRPERNVGARPLRETVHFEAEGTAPNQRSVARLQMLEHELRDRAGEINHVILEGYADPTEPHAMSRSQARAEAVRQRLVSRIPSLFFEIIPRGAANPIAPNDTPKGRSLNRRVQIYLAEEEHIAEQQADEELGQDEVDL
ncbi:MAG: outer membrane protein OmpA-like peptidoglycan-associated protein, partial [Kiritimatiellia bacterium]